VISPAEWSRWNVSLRLVVAPAWPAVGVAQPATRPSPPGAGARRPCGSHSGRRDRLRALTHERRRFGIGITIGDLLQQSINHAIGIIIPTPYARALPGPIPTWNQPPAQRADGFHFTDRNNIPEGAIFRLPRNLDLNAYPATQWDGVSPKSVFRLIAEAMQNYGCVVYDQGGTAIFVSEKGDTPAYPSQSLFAGAARVDHGRRIYGSQRVSLEKDAGSENESRVKNVSYLRTGSSYFRFRGPPARREKLRNFPIRDSNEPSSATVFHLQRFHRI